ncbi:MAG: hypothetical protein A4E49_02970 [Methanosaeta sp. PtaU1.Bin112]|nr:MAG: hypothetical protein A4E49_02970 [Methanosaeta sp. PtaU1.Bin112]
MSRMGWNVMPTSSNARGIDIIAYSTDGLRFVTMQVKALSKRNPAPIGNSLDKIMGDFWIIIVNVSQDPHAFVMLPSEVKQMAHKGVKEGRISYWLQPVDYDRDDFRERWDRIGRGDGIGDKINEGNS